MIRLFNHKLYELRIKNRLSQEKIAEILGVSRQAVTKWELGDNYPDINNLINLSNLFNTTIDHLLKEEDPCMKENSRLEENTLDIIEFLLRAKKSSYAAKGVEEKASRPNSHDLIYLENEYMYIDTYLGGHNFIGEEGIWIKQKPYWGMNYTGRVLDKQFSSGFLKDALMKVSQVYPYRGPLLYIKGDFVYHCNIKGEFKWFQGDEEIYYKGVKTYECCFHGGNIL